MKTLVKLPQIGANEDVAFLIEWQVQPGERVQVGQALCTVETTKSVVDIEAERAGFAYPLVAEGVEVAVETPIAVIADDEERWQTVRAWAQTQTAVADPSSSETPARSWTKKAELLARRHNVSIETLLAMHDSERLTAADAERLIARLQESPRPAAVRDLVDDVFPHNRIERVLILGGGDGAVQVLDAIAHAPHQRAVAILDDNEALWGKSMMGVPILGGMEQVAQMWEEGRFDAAIISISSNLTVRARLFEQWRGQGVPFTNIIAPNVMVHSNVRMGRGNLIMSNARLGAGAQLGDNNFLSAFVNLEHHNRLGSHCTFGPMVTTSGRVRIGDRVTFGAGVFIEPHLTIGDDCIIASGSIIRANIPANVVVKTHIQQSIRPR
jgi:sugar O-acyltransferase (sialic acid O-acetyltransferase NeuD family)